MQEISLPHLCRLLPPANRESINCPGHKAAQSVLGADDIAPKVGFCQADADRGSQYNDGGIEFRDRKASPVI
jgi:hypothetical protein